jgi:predicted nucleotide-binding protein (sugar kinase/HSP70/actin superfamily)
VKKGVGLIFIPHVVRMPHPSHCRDSYLCPITQAGPYFLAKAFPDRRLLSPVLEFINGYETCSALVDMAVEELGVSRERAISAWAAAVQAQTEAECTLRDFGKQALHAAIASGKPAILLAGHSYNALPLRRRNPWVRNSPAWECPLSQPTASCLPGKGPPPGTLRTRS